MVIEIERTRSLDEQFPPEQLYGAIYGGERNAHKFIITSTRDGAEIALSGTVTARFLRADNVDVALEGTIEDGKACVTLGDECYAVPGRYKLAIFVTSGTETLCVYAAIGNSDRTAGSSTVDGGEIIESVADLIADIEAARATIPATYTNLMAGVAGTYDATKTYAVGDYAWYDGQLKRCIVPITTAESWTAAHWANAVIGDDVNSLKSATNIITASWTLGQSYNTPSSVTTIQPNATTTTAGYACTYMTCSQGDVFYLTGKGGSGSKLWVWTKTDGTIISRANSNAVETHLKLVAPANAAYLLSSVDVSQAYSLVKGDTVNGRIETAKTLATYRNLGDYSTYNIVYGKIDLLSALRPIPEKEMSSTVFYHTSVFDFETYATALAISTLYEPLRVRDESGNQIAPIYCQLDAAKYKTAIVAYGYKADGMNDRPYRAADVVDGVLTLDSTTYYLVLHQYSNLDLLIGTEAPSYAAEYHVGAGREYTTFHACIAALNGDDTPKTIHVYGGTYDVLSELGGADFLDGLTGAENWYDVCDIIPPNTHVIGHGNVIFDLTIPSGTSADIAVLLSPINIMGSATIENVTINCNGGRYCVHAEGERMTAYDNAVWRLLNCKINKSGNLSGVANAIGVGINNGDLLEIRDCVITNDGNAGILVHDQQTVSGSYPYSPRIFVSNCAIDVAYYPVVMSSTHSGATSGAVLEMTVNNCFVNNKFMRKIGNGKADVFKATYINTPHRTQNGDGILNIIPDTEYNNFALT